MVILISVPSQARQSVPFPGGGSISYSNRDGKTLFEICNRRGQHYVLNVDRDSTVASEVEPSDLMVVGTIKSSVIILVDTYPSVPGGMSYCQAGEERFLRVISMSKKTAIETLRIKAESCRNNIELASPGIEWFPKSSILRVHWLQGPSLKQKPEELKVWIGADGKTRKKTTENR